MPVTPLDLYLFSPFLREESALTQIAGSHSSNQKHFSLFLTRLSISPIFRTLFQVPYPVTLLFATLTKTAGVSPNSSHNGTPLQLFGVSPRAGTFGDHRSLVASAV